MKEVVDNTSAEYIMGCGKEVLIKVEGPRVFRPHRFWQ